MNNKYIEYKSHNSLILYFLSINKKLIKKFIINDSQPKFPNSVTYYRFNNSCSPSTQTLVSLNIRKMQEVYVAAILLSNFL